METGELLWEHGVAETSGQHSERVFQKEILYEDIPWKFHDIQQALRAPRARNSHMDNADGRPRRVARAWDRTGHMHTSGREFCSNSLRHGTRRVSWGLLVDCRGIPRVLVGGSFFAESGASHASVLRYAHFRFTCPSINYNTLRQGETAVESPRCCSETLFIPDAVASCASVLPCADGLGLRAPLPCARLLHGLGNAASTLPSLKTKRFGRRVMAH